MSEGTLTVYQRMNDPLAAVKLLGNSIAKSGMYGCGSVEAGEVLALECLHQNTPPMSILRRFNIMFGKLSMKAEAMLAGFEAEGGEYKIVTRSPDLVRVVFTIKGQPHDLSLSWEEAQKEPFVYHGKEETVVDQLLAGKKPPLKPKYATPRSRMQMMWARLVSDSVRFLCPRVVTGVYTPEEIEDWNDSDEAGGRSRKNGNAKPSVSASVVEQVAATVTPANVIDAEFEKKAATEPQPDFATADQRLVIERLFDQCGMNADHRIAALAKRKCGTLGMRDLLATAAAELIAALEKKLAQVKAAHDAKLPELSPGTEQLPAVCGPCTEEQDKRIRAAFEEWNQTDPKACGAAFVEFRKKLKESGRQRILDLSANDAARLYDAIGVRKLDSFIKLSLETWKPAAASGSSSEAKQPAAA